MSRAIVAAAFFISVFNGGCTPPDWSVCDCQWLDNFWFHHITMLHSYSGPTFIHSLLTRGTPIHDWVMRQECPEQVHTFLYNAEGKTYSFDPAGVMKLSHESYRPENREQIKNICPAGNLLLHFWCSHQFLYKAGVPEYPGNETTRWTWLRGWYAHMRAMQQLLDQEEIMKCLPRSSFPFNENTTQHLFSWNYASIGNSSKGEEPRLLFNSGTGLIHLPSFVYSGRLVHSRRNVNPKNKVCIPISDMSCWPLRAVYQPDSCSLCCDPNKGPFGDASCWKNGRSYERCCQQDFKNVKCEEIRKSTPGCIDCPQSLSFFCEEAHKFDAVKAWQHMNETYHEYLAELNVTRDLELEIRSNLSQIASLEPLFKQLLESDVIPQQTNYYMHISSSEYRKHISRVRLENKTLAWLSGEIRPPVSGNHSVVSKELRKLTDVRKTANTTLIDNQRKQVWETERKSWLIERIANNTVEIVHVQRDLDSIDFIPLWEVANYTVEQLIVVNASLDNIQAEERTLISEIEEIEEARKNRENELGIPQEINATGVLIEFIRNEMGKLESPVKNAKGKVESMNTRKQDCLRADQAPAAVKELESLLKSCIMKIESIETSLTQLDQELGQLKAPGDVQSLASLESLREQSESLSSRISDLRGECSRILKEHKSSAWESFALSQSIVRNERIIESLSLEARAPTRRPTKNELLTLQTKIVGLRKEISTGSKSYVSKRAELNRLREYYVNHHFLESFLVHAYPSEFGRILSELLPDIILPDALAKFQRWNSFLAQFRRIEWPSSFDPHEPLLNMKRMQLRSLLSQRDQQVADLKRWQLNEWRNHLILIEIRLRRKEILRLHKALGKNRNAATHLRERLFMCKVESVLLQRSQEKVNELMAKRAAYDEHAERVIDLTNKREHFFLLLERANTERTQAELKLKETRGQVSSWKRSCRHYNEASLSKSTQELEELDTKMDGYRNQVTVEFERQASLNRSLDSLRGADEKLVELMELREMKTKTLQTEVTPKLFNITVSQKLLIGNFTANQQSLQQLYRKNDSLTLRKQTLLLETPKFEAELAVKDEVIFNTTIKQNQSKQIMLDVAPNITDKELNLTSWTTKLDYINDEMKRVNSTLQSRISDLEQTVGWPPLVSMDAFKNISHRLNETYYNLTQAEEALANSTNRTAELVKEFRLAEKNYIQKEHELKEYTKLVDAGIIPKVNFTFEY